MKGEKENEKKSFRLPCYSTKTKVCSNQVVIEMQCGMKTNLKSDLYQS